MLRLFLQATAALSLSAVGYVVFLFGSNYIRTFTSPVALLPGPKRQSLLKGNFIFSPESDSLRRMEDWISKYGRAIRYYTFFGVSDKGILKKIKPRVLISFFFVLFQQQKMLTVDLKAVSHILKDGYVYEKSDQIRHDLGALLGRGLLFVTGELNTFRFKIDIRS
jgi:hypothetical protein